MADGKIQSIEDSVKIEAPKKTTNAKTKLIAGIASFIFTVGGLSAFAKIRNSSENKISPPTISKDQLGGISASSVYQKAIRGQGQEIEQNSVTSADIVKPGEMKILEKKDLVTEFDGQVEVCVVHDGKKYSIPKLFSEQDYSNFDKVHTYFIQSTGGDVDNAKTFGILNDDNKNINVKYADNINSQRLIREYGKAPEGASDLLIIYDFNDNNFVSVLSLNKKDGVVKIDRIGSTPTSKDLAVFAKTK